MKKPTIFLDRDGTIIEDVGVLKEPDQIVLIPQSAEAIRAFNDLGFYVFVITNQAGIARGKLGETDVERVHQTLDTMLEALGARIDRYYYCPHHPTDALVLKYNLVCDCRKPNIGLVRQAENDFGIDLGNSFFIGDMTTDIATGNALGIKTILLKTGHAGEDNRYDHKPDHVAENLFDTIRIITDYVRT